MQKSSFLFNFNWPLAGRPVYPLSFSIPSPRIELQTLAGYSRICKVFLHTRTQTTGQGIRSTGVSSNLRDQKVSLWRRDYLYERCRTLHTHKPFHHAPTRLLIYQFAWILRAIPGTTVAISVSKSRDSYLKLICGMVISNWGKRTRYLILVNRNFYVSFAL
jgi:hypothetical protein